MTVVASSASLAEMGLSARVMVPVGASSSSVMVRGWSAGALIPWPPETVAETVRVLFGVSTLLFAAVIVTVPVLVVVPAGIFNCLLALSVKSEAVAGETSFADTLSVTSSLEAALSVAVTVDTPPFSEIDDGVRTRDTAGPSSSSVMVKLVPVTESPLAVVVPVTETVSPEPSSMVSCVGSMEKDWIPVHVPAAMVSVRSSTLA